MQQGVAGCALHPGRQRYSSFGDGLPPLPVPLVSLVQRAREELNA